MYQFYTKSKARIRLRACVSLPPARKLGALIVFLFFTLSLFAQSPAISLKESHAPLKKVFQDIGRQTGFEFLASGDVIDSAIPVTVDIKNQTLPAILDLIFRQQPLQYEIRGKIIVVTKQAQAAQKAALPATSRQQIAGYVTDSLGTSLTGASVKNESAGTSTQTGKDGKFIIDANPGDKISISYVGYKPYGFVVPENLPEQHIVLYSAPNKLNSVVIIGYGTTTKRLNTGSVSGISATEISKQPVTNVLSAISGTMPGVFVQTANGLPGGGIKVQIRGQGSIAAGTDPLYIVDGVPFAPTVVSPNETLGFSAINGAVSPLNSINPSDIETITVLKDADATAIYGSRGSNGVILITTKKGKAGKTRVYATLSTGTTQAANLPRLLNGRQYLQIRNEAFANDGLVPSNDVNDPNYAPDLRVWDTTRTTNWAKYLFGGTGHVADFQSTLSGGNQHTNFVVGANYHRETTVLPGDNLYLRGGMHANIQHISENRKFNVEFSTSYTADNNRLTNLTANFGAYLMLPPDFPLYDETGNYNYTLGYNPLAGLASVSKTKTNNVLINSTIKYAILKGLNFRISAGYNRINFDQTMTNPTNAQYQGSINYTDFGSNSNENIIAEPQLDFVKQLGKSTLSLLAGGTYQQTTRQNQFIEASNFSNDLMLENLSSATTFSTHNYTINYRYLSFFGRVNYNMADKYLFNFTVRRDGSSRFGPDNQFGTFGAIGAGWLFSNEGWWKEHLGFVSYGKLRANYGLTGNDQITDYQYLAAYQSSGYTYQNIAAIQPARLFNPDFHWETTHKFEAAIELGFLSDRILLDVNRYQSRTTDQLVNFATPRITGFTSYQANLPAKVENTGWEINLTSKNIDGQKFKWSTSFNITLPQNKLLSFKGLATSSYANTLAIGQPITRVYGYQFTGLDAQGLPLFRTQSGMPVNAPSTVTDGYYTLGKGYPDFYGGISNTFAMGAFSVNVTGAFARQSAFGGLVYTPGIIGNGYVNLMNRWQNPGTPTTIPKSSTATNYYLPYAQSSANFFNTSYFRVKNISIEYLLAKNLTQKLQMDELRLYLHAQNLITFWNKNNPLYDPETGFGTNIPPLKIFTIGIQASF